MQFEVYQCHPFKLFIVVFKAHTKALIICWQPLKMLLRKWIDFRKGIIGAYKVCFLSSFLWLPMSVPCSLEPCSGTACPEL